MEDKSQENDLSKLNEVQREGVTRYELTREQVTRPNFGQHTLGGMRTLQLQDRRLTNQEAFNMLSGLNDIQINGITQYNLNRNQVETANFGNHTLNGILNLRLQNVPFNQAFDRVRGLENATQITGVTEYNLTHDQVRTDNFGMHTLTGIDSITNQIQGINNHQAFDLISGLNEPQVLGFTNYGLTQNEVRTHNFGTHTLSGIDSIIAQNQGVNNHQAFDLIGGLNEPQARGVIEFGLTQNQVRNNNFGSHTLGAVISLLALNRVENAQDAFAMVSNLNNQQTIGVRRGLERAEVTSANFGIHTLIGIQHLQEIAARNGNNNLSYPEAFQTVRELTAVQVRGITDLELNRDQVLNPRFGNETIGTIKRLQMINPEATNQYLYEAAMGLPEYQIRGLTQLRLSAEQVGLTVVDNQFVQLNPENEEVASGRTIDAIEHLISTEFIPVQEAYEIAMRLNSDQVLSMMDFGISLKMVLDSDLEKTDGSYGILNVLAHQSTRSNSELNLPLSEEEKQSLRDEISRSGSLQSLSQSYQEASLEEANQELSARSDISDTEATNLPYAAAASLPQQNEMRNSPIDLNAFTRAMSLNSIAEKSSVSSNGYPSDEERKPVAKKGKDAKKSSRRDRKP